MAATQYFQPSLQLVVVLVVVQKPLLVMEVLVEVVLMVFPQEQERLAKETMVVQVALVEVVGVQVPLGQMEAVEVTLQQVVTVVRVQPTPLLVYL